MSGILKFPEEFLWGASTSSHQVEGGNNNDWTEWELANADRLASESLKFKSKSPVWEQIQPEAINPKNYISGMAADHYNRYDQDFEIAQNLDMNTMRISVEWSRIEPEEGRFDSEALHHYKEVVQSLRSRGLEPFVTLWHWTLPKWFASAGGWKSKAAPAYFERYCTKVAEELGGDVRFWITLNEPEVYADQAYRAGVWPPQEKSLRTSLKVSRNLILGHRLGYQAIKRADPDSQVGISKHNIYFNLHRHRVVDSILRSMAKVWWNAYFLNQIADFQDFIGLNHYQEYHHKMKRTLISKQHIYQSDMGWELQPQAIYFVLKDLMHYQKPIYITENGLADRKDNYRGWYMQQVLVNIHRAMREGVDVRGYLHWSLLDNFEWDKGFWPRFGLIEVDYRTLERIPRGSALEYARIIRQNGVDSATDLPK